MERRKFTREFKLEAVRLIKERGVSYAQASHDLSVHQSQLRGWVKALADDPQQAFPGQGQMKPEQLEIAQLKREVNKLKAERDIVNTPPPKGGGFELRLKAGFGPPSADSAQVTVKLSSGSGGFWFLMYPTHASSVAFCCWQPSRPCPAIAGPRLSASTLPSSYSTFGSVAIPAA